MFERFISFDADKGGTGGGPAVPATPATVPASATPATIPASPAPATSPSAGPAGTPITQTVGDLTGEGGQPGVTPITLTSAQLSERLERARSGERTALAKSLGFDSLEAMTESIKKGQEAIKASMTEAERQAATLKEAQDKLAQMQSQIEEGNRLQAKALIRTAAVELMAGRFAKPSAAFKLLDLSSVEAQADGTVKGLQEAVEKLAKDEPWTLLAQPNLKKDLKTGVNVAGHIGPTNPEGGEHSTESDDDRRARYFGPGRANSGFFSGGGLKQEINKRPK